MRSKGIDVKRLDQDGKTALYKATDEDKAEIIEFLIKNGAEVNKPNKDGKTPLHAAVTIRHNNPSQTTTKKIIELLLEDGSNLNAQDINGDTALHLALREYTEHHHIPTELLLEHGADPTVLNAAGKMPFAQIELHDVPLSTTYHQYNAVQAFLEGTVSAEDKTFSFVDLKGDSQTVSIDGKDQYKSDLNPELLKNRAFAQYPIDEAKKQLQHVQQNIKNIITIKGPQPELQKIADYIDPLIKTQGQELAYQAAAVIKQKMNKLGQFEKLPLPKALQEFTKAAPAVPPKVKPNPGPKPGQLGKSGRGTER